MKLAAIAQGPYRYQLTRIWEEAKPRIVWVMLNPSTADHEIDDATIKKCISYSIRWGYGSLEVVNLFAYRSTDPEELKNCADPVGEDNDAYITDALTRASMVVLAWGEHGKLKKRSTQVLELIRSLDRQVHALKRLKGGEPGHPLYLKNDAQPFLF